MALGVPDANLKAHYHAVKLQFTPPLPRAHLEFFKRDDV